MGETPKAEGFGRIFFGSTGGLFGLLELLVMNRISMWSSYSGGGGGRATMETNGWQLDPGGGSPSQKKY